MSVRKGESGGAATSFQCQICEATFTRRANLKRHQLVHTGAKRHACHICAQPFTLRYNLRRHLLKQHGVVLDVLVQSRRDKKAAKRLLRKLLKRQCRAPRVMITELIWSQSKAA
jgi:putative transposase